MKNMTSFPWQVLQINNILVTFSLLSIYTSKFLTWQFFLVKEKLARQIFLDKENLSTIPHLHEQFFLVKENLSRKNCSCKWGLKGLCGSEKTVAYSRTLAQLSSETMVFRYGPVRCSKFVIAIPLLWTPWNSHFWRPFKSKVILFWQVCSI